MGQQRRGSSRAPFDSVRLLAVRNIAAFAAGGDAETIPSPVDGVTYPMHPLVSTTMGMAAFDNLQFEDLRQVSPRRTARHCLFVVGPLGLLSGTGSPVNPTAVF